MKIILKKSFSIFLPRPFEDLKDQHRGNRGGDLDSQGKHYFLTLGSVYDKTFQHEALQYFDFRHKKILNAPPEKLFELNNCPGVAKTQVWEVNDNLKKKTSQRCNCREPPK